MKKLVNFSLTALCVATLAACSGGGGGSGSSEQQTTTVNTQTTTQTTTTQTPTTQTVTPSNVANVAATGLKNGTVTPTSVTVDGKELALALPGIITGGDSQIMAGNVEIVKNIEGAQYIGFVSEGSGKQRYAYYGSNQAETSVMPVTGSARYEGDVVYSYGGILEADDNGVADGDINLTVDFANKTLVGTIDDTVGGAGTQSTAQVKGNISGSGFTGTVSTASTSADLAGKFYGTNAASLAGVFGDKNNTLSGAFEADKK